MGDKLFIVSMGEIGPSVSYFMGQSSRSFYVIANSYDEANQKVERVISAEIGVNRMISSDGSLIKTPEVIKEIRLITDEIIK